MPSNAILEQKKQQVAALSELLKSSVSGVVVDYSGITVAEDTKLRKELREAGCTYKVVKNTLLSRALKEAGIDTKISHFAFCTNGSHYAGEAGIRTIGFGPSRENLAHTVDEYVEIEQLEKAMLGYIGIMEALLKED